MKSRRTFSAEFEREAVRMLSDPDRPMAEVATSPGIDRCVLCSWTGHGERWLVSSRTVVCLRRCARCIDGAVRSTDHPASTPSWRCRGSTAAASRARSATPCAQRRCAGIEASWDRRRSSRRRESSRPSRRHLVASSDVGWLGVLGRGSVDGLLRRRERTSRVSTDLPPCRRCLAVIPRRNTATASDFAA